MAVGKSPQAIEITKPRIDKREYRRIVLSNSLEVLLISDPDTDKSAASMDVSVGYFSDPEDLEGLAHFLGKVEETPRPLKDVMLVSYEIIHKKDPTAIQRIKQRGLPVAFYKKHLPKVDSKIILVDEEGKESDTTYLAGKTCLSAGWRGFAMKHQLADGDAVVFLLVEKTKFKIYIIRAKK